MKKTVIAILVFVLTAAIFTGCGCRNSKPMNTAPTTQPTTAPTTAPTTQATMPTTDPTRATIEDGNGPLPTNATAGADGDTSSATEDTGLGGEARSRSGNNGRTNGGTIGGSQGSMGSVG